MPIPTRPLTPPPSPSSSEFLSSSSTKATYRAKPILYINDVKAPDNLMDDILQISVEESLHHAGMFTLVIQNEYKPGREEDKTWRYEKLLQIGKQVRIGFMAGTTESPDFARENTDEVIKGEITAISTYFTDQTQAPVIVQGYDFSHRLHRGRYSRSFVNTSDSKIAEKIIKEMGIKIGNIENSRIVHDYVFQENQTNMEFLRERAAKIGFEMYIQDGKAYFRKPKADKQSLTLEWLKDLQSFRVRVNSAEQVKEVEVRGWDYGTKKPIISKATNANVITNTKNGKGSDKSNKFSGKPSKPKMILVDQPVFNVKEADTMAQALCDELGGQFIHADAIATGNALIRPGKVVNLTEMGPHDGKYYITETRHTYDDRIYRTEFSVRGLRGGDLLTTLAPQTKLQPGQTFLVGIVTDNEDPKGWGRVKVRFPTLTDTDNSNWARVVAPGAGKDRGVYWLPEINDEVLVGFEHGDIHRPYIIGGVWNGVDKTPKKVKETVVRGKVRLRQEKTRVGHTVTFVDDDKGIEKRGYYIKTATGIGHSLSFNDTLKFIEIKTSGRHKIRLDDKQRIVEIITLQGQRILLNDITGSISIGASGVITTTAGGAINTTAGGALTMKAGGTITITAPTIILNGAVIINGKPLPY